MVILPYLQNINFFRGCNFCDFYKFLNVLNASQSLNFMSIFFRFIQPVEHKNKIIVNKLLQSADLEA